MRDDLDKLINKIIEGEKAVENLSDSEREEVSKYIMRKRMKQTLTKMYGSSGYVGDKRNMKTGKLQ